MSVVPYYFRFHQGTGVAVRAYLNDLLFYKGDGAESMTITSPCNHLLVPGENVFFLEVTEAPKPAFAPFVEGPVRFSLMIDDDEDTVVHRADWPELWKLLPSEERCLPTLYTSRFQADEALPKPIYEGAPRAEFGPEGTPELREAVRRAFQAYASGDVERFLDEFGLRLADRQRFYPDIPELSLAQQRPKIAANLAEKWHMRPTDLEKFEDIVFEPRAGGRVCFVTRRGGGYAIEAVNASDPSSVFTTDLFLTQQAGVWRIFR
ncbi:MAG: hypothetical protein U0359_18060 [Byssovorax sp.]